MNCARKRIARFILQSRLIKNNRQRAHDRELLYKTNRDNASDTKISDIRTSRSLPSPSSTTLEYCASLGTMIDTQKTSHNMVT